MLKIRLLIFCLLVCFTIGAQTMPELKKQLGTAHDSVEIAKIISRMGNVRFEEGAFLKAAECFFQSLDIAERWHDKTLVAVNRNNLAATYMETENYVEAEQHAKKAIALYQELKEAKGLANAYNSLGNVYYMQEKDSLCLLYFKQSLAQRKIAQDSAGLFKGYKNLGALYFEMADTATGIRYMKESFSYIRHPTDTISWFSGYLSLAEVFVSTNDLKMAKVYFDKCLPYLPGISDYAKLEDYYSWLSDYHKKSGDYKSAMETHQLYAAYRDSVVNKVKNGQLAELNVKYETDKKQQLIQEQQFEIARKNYWIAGVLIVLMLGSLAAYLWYRNVQYRRIKKLQEEAFLQKERAAGALFEGEQNERIRIARDLHDSIGQQLAAVKMKLNALPPGKEVDDAALFLDGTIKEVRSISHNLLPEALQFGWVPAVEELCEQMSVPGGPLILFTVNDYARTYTFTKQQELSIYRIIQEIISNTIRHAVAQRITIDVQGDDNKFTIQTTDDGKGMDLAVLEQSQGIGWKNITARVNMLRGNMEISSSDSKGTQINIAIPLL